MNTFLRKGHNTVKFHFFLFTRLTAQIANHPITCIQACRRVVVRVQSVRKGKKECLGVSEHGMVVSAKLSAQGHNDSESHRSSRWHNQGFCKIQSLWNNMRNPKEDVSSSWATAVAKEWEKEIIVHTSSPRWNNRPLQCTTRYNGLWFHLWK